jgi:hypothetical protein
VEDILFIIGSSQEDRGTAQLVHHLLDESSHTYPQLSNVRSIQVPLQKSKLQDWSGWLAIEVVDQWINSPSSGHSIDTVIANLGLAESENKNPNLLVALSAGVAGESLSSELLRQISSIRDQYNQLNYSYAELQRWLEQKNIELSHWFSQTPESSISQDSTHTGLDRVQFNAEALSIKIRLYFKEEMVSWRQAGLQLTLEFLQALGENLTTLYTDYDQQRQTYKIKEDSAWRAFNNLRTQLQQRSFMPRKRSVTFEAVLQGLLKVYSFKLKAEVYSQACQIVGKLRQEIYLLSFEFVQANDFLKRLKDEFWERNPREPFFSPLLKQNLTQCLDLIKFRREIEGMLGSPLSSWGSLRPSQVAIIRQQILSQLNPLCLEVYAKCYTSLMNLQTPESQFEYSHENIDSLNSKDLLDGSQKQQKLNFLQDPSTSQDLENQESIESDISGYSSISSSPASFVNDSPLNNAQ